MSEHCTEIEGVVREGIWRKVVERLDVPYDTDINGQPLTVRMDLLECGHRKRPHIKEVFREERGERATWRPTQYRRCWKCEKGEQ